MTPFPEKELDRFRVPPGSSVSLRRDFDPGHTGSFLSREDAEEQLASGIRRLADLQEKLYAQNTYALLINLQATDAAGKDSTVKHVMSGVNPQGVQVKSFKAPSDEELDHDYLWRTFVALPNRGNIGIFNRSYYEEVLAVRVHPELLARQQLPPRMKTKEIWKRRFEEINNFEKYLTSNGIVVLKIFLNVSKDVQKKRFLERIREPEKNWKFSSRDVFERRYWDDYMDACDDMFRHTSTGWAPWYIIPADRKWFTRLAVVSVINSALEGLDLAFPKISTEEQKALRRAQEMLDAEDREAVHTPSRSKKRNDD